MARLLVNGEWYEALSSFTMLEGEYERLVLTHSRHLFPDLFAVAFKKPLEYKGEVRTPDLALIDHQYRNWWVVEVELSHHRLWEEVVPQIEVFLNTTYGSDEAEYLRARDSSLDLRKLVDMMKGAPPQVLVIVDTVRQEWVQVIARFGARISVVEVFRSDRGQHILRLNGDYPASLGDVISVCSFDPIVPRALALQSPAALELGDGEDVVIEYEGTATWWRRLTMADGIWLAQRRGTTIPRSTRQLEIVRRADGRLLFHQPDKKRRESLWP